MTSPFLYVPERYAPNIRVLNLYGIAQASLPTSPVDDEWDYEYEQRLEILIRGSQYRPGARAYQIVGSSMGDTLRNGEIALVDPNDAYNTHRPCVFETPNGHIVKRRGLKYGRPVLLSDNPQVAPISDMTDIKAVGSVYAAYLRPFTIRQIS